HGHALDARHRARERDAVVRDDDHAAQGDPAGDRLPVDGERALLRGDERDLWHADGGRARDRARRAGGHADPGRVLLPDPRAVRQPRLEAPREAQGDGPVVIEILAVLGFPLAGAALLALVGHRAYAPLLNAGASLATL